MLSRIRRIFAHSWVARIMAVLLVAAFGAWGIQGALTGGGGGPDDVATVGGQSVTTADLEGAYQRALDQAAAQMARSQGGAPDPSALPPPLRREIGGQVLRQLVVQKATAVRAHSLGLVVPDATVRDEILSIPAFKGTDGQFDRQRYEQVLAASHMTQPRLVGLVRDDLLFRGLLEPVRSAAVVPAATVGMFFDYIAQTRTIEMATVPFASIPVPPAPADDVLRRFYANHRAQFQSPEYRKIKAVVLSPSTMARDVAVPEADIKALYAQEEPRLYKPSRRSVQVVTVATKAMAEGVADLWRGGAQWASVEALAQADGGTAVSLANAGEREFPSPSLGHAVFAADEGAITDPFSDGAGWVVLRVIGSEAASGDYASERDRLREQLAEKRAAAVIQDKVDRLQDAIAGGGLDRIPADLGALPAEGTLDAQGRTPAGEPAPLPGSDALKAALVAHAFEAKTGAAPSLIQGPDGSYYAVAVESVTPSRKLSFDEARPLVLKAWQDEAVRHAAETKAAGVFAAARAAHALGPAATAAGLTVSRPPPFRRGGTPGAVPAQVAQIAFGLKPGEATMVRVGDAYDVAVLTGVQQPSASADAGQLEQLGRALRGQVASDLEQSYSNALLTEIKPKLNDAAAQRVIGQP